MTMKTEFPEMKFVEIDSADVIATSDDVREYREIVENNLCSYV